MNGAELDENKTRIRIINKTIKTKIELIEHPLGHTQLIAINMEGKINIKINRERPHKSFFNRSLPMDEFYLVLTTQKTSSDRHEYLYRQDFAFGI